jgi:molybdopterin-guanine dinucleotide biosynthesis protein
MKVIVVGGYPGSGKSTIVRRMIELLEKQGHTFKSERKGIVSWMESKELIILGTYAPSETFPGTDRFPLNVQPEAQKFLLSKASGGKVIFFEGDRLFNEKMLAFLEEHFEVVLCIVSMSRKLLEQRRNARSEQNVSWRKGRETKVDRLAMTHPVHHHLQNDTKADKEQAALELVAEINGEWTSTPVKSKIKSFWS